MYRIIASLFATMILSAILTPFIRLLAFKVGAVDNPNARRVNKVPMPTMGGLAIFLAFNVTNFLLLRKQYPIEQLWALLLAECIILATGIIDDIYELKPRQKIYGITLAALVVFFIAKIKMTTITLPFLGTVTLGWLSLPITVTGYFFLNVTNTFISIMMFTLVAALIGFLPYNFHPAKIYLGDTGSLFIGFMISVFALYGLKNATFITIIIPVIILGVPITDTVYAILRRILNKKPISQADKHHLHHRLMQMGLSHRQTVLVIYGIALIFSSISLLYPISSFWGSVLLTVATLLGLEIFVEVIGLVGESRRPLLNFIKKIVLLSENKIEK